MPRKRDKTKAKPKAAGDGLDEFAEKLTESMAKNLEHNLEHPDEAERHDADVQSKLDAVMKGSDEKKK